MKTTDPVEYERLKAELSGRNEKLYEWIKPKLELIATVQYNVQKVSTLGFISTNTTEQTNNTYKRYLELPPISMIISVIGHIAEEHSKRESPAKERLQRGTDTGRSTARCVSIQEAEIEASKTLRCSQFRSERSFSTPVPLHPHPHPHLHPPAHPLGVTNLTRLRSVPA